MSDDKIAALTDRLDKLEAWARDPDMGVAFRPDDPRLAKQVRIALTGSYDEYDSELRQAIMEAPEPNREERLWERLYGKPIDHREVRALAQSYLDREDEDWTFSDPEDIRRLARAVLAK